MDTWTDLKTRVLAVICPVCGASAGAMCRAPAVGGIPARETLHPKRATAAGEQEARANECVIVTREERRRGR